MSDLERRLIALAGVVDYPPTPDLGRSVRERLAREPGGARAVRPRRGFARRRTLAIALAAFLLACGSAMAASSAIRDAVLDLLGLGGVEIRRVPDPPSAPVRAPEAGLGRRVAVQEARERPRYRVPEPHLPDLGAPSAAYFRRFPPGGQVAFFYDLPAGGGGPEAPGQLLFSVFRGGEITRYIEKSLGPGTRAEEVTVHGRAAIWLSGRPHSFVYRDAAGQLKNETLRLAGNTLLWERNGLTLRLEGAPTREEALRIAASVR